MRSSPDADAHALPDQLAGLFAHAPVVFAALAGPEHRLEGANEAFFDVVGRERSRESLGRPVARIVPELVHQGLLDILDAVYRDGVPYVAHNADVLLGPLGRSRRRWFDFSFEPRRLPDGRITGVAFIAVDVTRQRAALKLAAEQQALLEQIARDAPLPDVLDGMCRAIEKLSPKVLGSVLLVDATGRRLVHGAAPSLPDAYNKAADGTPIAPGAGSCGTAAYRREMVVVSDIATDPLWDGFYRTAAQRAGLAACWSSPILSSTGELLGTFAMYHRTPRELREEDLDLSIVFTRTAALAIERDRAEQGRRRAQAQVQEAGADLAFVLRTSTAVSEEAHYPQNLQQLARFAVPALGPVCAIDVSEEGRIDRVAVAVDPELPDGIAQLMASRPPGSPVGRVLATGVKEVTRTVPAGPWTEAGLAVTGQICLPLTARGHTFGALTLLATAERPLDQRTVALAEELARTAAAGADTTRQYDRRARLARDLQAGLLLAALPEVPGARLAASYRPAGEGLEIGGDFYDVFPLPGDWWGLVIGDVCGRGAHAATTTALVRNTARAVAPLLPTPDAVARSVNDALLDRTDSESFVTLVYAELRPVRDGMAVSLVQAGHPAPLLRRADGTVQPTQAVGQLLGVTENPELPLESVDLRSGDALVLVTDGILEARNPAGELFGEDRLTEALASVRGPADAQGLLDAVVGAVDGFARGVCDDDQAVLVLVAE